MTYLDWAATTPCDRNILKKALDASIETFANPSSPHSPGLAAKALLEDSRSTLLASLTTLSGGRKPEGGLAFTASGTEADQIPLLALFRQLRKGAVPASAGTAKPHLLISAIEHSAIHAQAEALSRLGFDLSLVKPDRDGIVQPSRVAEALRPSTRLVAVMAVNNETGAVQDIAAIGKAIASAASSLGTRLPLFHVDCVQALGKLRSDFLGGIVTSAAFSAHKIQGPKGVGALWYGKPIEALALGGGQEGGVRSGTENLFGIAAFALCAASAKASMDSRLDRALVLERRLLEGLEEIPGARVIPQGRKAGDPRWSPWIASAAFPGLGGEVLARALSDEGIAVSTGSACSHTQATKGRRILRAMDLPEDLSFSSVRVSFGPGTETGEVDLFLSKAEDLYRRLKT